MIKINFTKMHGLGNDFVVIDARKNNHILTKDQIKLICDRKLGIGCDQLLIIRSNVEHNSNYDFIYQIFNSDATEVEQCGNGARCCIQYLTNMLQQSTHNTSTTPIIRLKSINRIISGYALRHNMVAVNLGVPKFLPEDLPCTHQFNSDNHYTYNNYTNNLNTDTNNIISYNIVSIGNPHIAIQLNSITELTTATNLTKLSNIAQLIQNSGVFPESVNVNFYVIEARHLIHLRTYERGCGFTNACGTGAAATVCCGIKRGLLDNSVQVHMLGGILTIQWSTEHNNQEIIMTGSATEVFNGCIEI